MSPHTFIGFLATASALLAAILARIDRRPAGRWLVFSGVLALFLFAGFRSVAINSDTRAYASYAVLFKDAGINDDPEIADRLEWGFRTFLHYIAFLLPEGDTDHYPRYVNLAIAVLGALLLCRAVRAAREKTGALLLIYLCSLFFVHQFAIVRLGLATIFFLNYFVRATGQPRARLAGLVFLSIGCLLHSTILVLAAVVIGWEFGLRATRRPHVEVGLLGCLVLLTAILGTMADRIAPLFLSGYNLSITARNEGFALSPKGLLEVTFCVILFFFHFKNAGWSYDRPLVRWRTLFYMTLVSFVFEAASGLPFAGRFRILCSCLFLMQTVLITRGINFKKRTTWLIFMVAAASIAAQIITISRDDGWFVIIPNS